MGVEKGALLFFDLSFSSMYLFFCCHVSALKVEILRTV